MEETRTELQMIKMSEIQSQEVAWLWYPFIPYGKLTIVQGDPGDGKTTLVLNIAAKLLILDPIQAYLGGSMDMNRANEARDMTKKLAALAEKYQCAIVLVGHMNKAAGNKAAYRGMGSIDFFAVARSVLLVGRVEGEANIRAVVQIKNNLAAFGYPKAFELSEDGFQWLGDYEITADEVLGGIAPKVNKLEQAKRLLREVAETNNAMQSNEIFNLAEEQRNNAEYIEFAGLVSARL